MAERKWRSDVRFVGGDDAAPEGAVAAAEIGERPFVIVILGDCAGNSRSEPSTASPLPERRSVEIDRDNVDAVLARWEAAWAGVLQTGGSGHSTAVRVRLRFQQLDDFHPDRIVQQIEPLRQLLAVRRDLDDPSRFDAAAAEVLRWAQPRPPASPPAPEPPPRRGISPSDLLEEILEGGPGAGPRRGAPALGDVQRLVEEIVAPHLVQLDRRRQEALIEAVDRGMADQLRQILHDPSFQRLEAVWRSIRWLVNRAETGALLKIRLLQLTMDELRGDLASSAAEDSALARLVLDPATVPGSERPALLVGLYEFGHTPEDLALLAGIGTIAGRLGAPFVAAASPALLGLDRFAGITSPQSVREGFAPAAYRDWQTFRASPEARWLGLALPRFLCRLPYGSDTEPITTFAFEEHAASDPARLVWSSPALAVAAVMADAFTRGGWALDGSATVSTLDGLPLYIHRQEGTATVTPCAEVFLSERTVSALEEIGVVPLVSQRDADTVALPCLQSLAQPRAPLWWRLPDS